jgi:hypothetical protein
MVHRGHRPQAPGQMYVSQLPNHIDLYPVADARRADSAGSAHLASAGSTHLHQLSSRFGLIECSADHRLA